MKRRQFLATAGALGALAVGGVAVRRATMQPPSLSAVVAELQSMRGKSLTATGAWSPYRVFSHLAQSVDLSITGYPSMKSSAFRHTAGRAVFFAFSTAGAMRHDLSAPIPGAPALPEDGPADAAIDELLAALARFERSPATLKPHFLYGVLSPEDYRIAHVMHVYNHLREIEYA